MGLICFDDEETFFALVEKVVARLNENATTPEPNKWISADEALKMLDLTHKTSLLRLRNAHKIKFTQPQKKVILYDRYSIIEYLDSNSRDTY